MVKAEWANGYGNVIYISHGYGYSTRYGHLSAYAAKPGQHVKRGDIIALRRLDRPLHRPAPALRSAPEQQPGQSARVHPQRVLTTHWPLRAAFASGGPSMAS